MIFDKYLLLSCKNNTKDFRRAQFCPEEKGMVLQPPSPESLSEGPCLQFHADIKFQLWNVLKTHKPTCKAIHTSTLKKQNMPHQLFSLPTCAALCDIYELGLPYGWELVVCVSCYRSGQRLLRGVGLQPNDRGPARPPGGWARLGFVGEKLWWRLWRNVTAASPFVLPLAHPLTHTHEHAARNTERNVSLSSHYLDAFALTHTHMHTHMHTSSLGPSQ